MPRATTIERRIVDEALLALLVASVPQAEGNPFPVILVDDPLPTTEKYAILTPIPSGEILGGSLNAPETDVAVEYDVTCVGADRRQAQWAADKVRKIMVGTDAGGGLLYPLTVEGHGELWRSQEGPIGGVTVVSGVRQVVDSYRVGVTRIDDPEE